MNLKKLITVMLVIVMLLLQFSFIEFKNFVYANNEEAISQNSEKYHYKQLTQEAKKLYDAIYEMYVRGILKTGTQSYDLIENGCVTQEQLEQYSNGNTTLTKAMDAARYAFYADHPEMFYVNIQKLRLRITKDAQNNYYANIGSGTFKNYYIDGFTSKEQVEEAITEFDSVVNEIVQKAQNIQEQEGANKKVEQIKLVHNEIINNTSYRLESDCTEGNEGFLGTPYGALVKKQAVCEGYARALKTILDKVGINCILVQGLHQSEGSAAIEHMWNYVEIEKETNARMVEKVWYAVDCTLDDPFLRIQNVDTTHPDFVPGDDIQEGFENSRWCMIGKESMNEHTVLENVEAAGNYKFQYPELSEEDYGIDYVTNVNGLLVKFKQDGTETEEYKAGDFYISYNKKGYANAVKEGKYILMKYHEYRPGDDIWREGNWGYMNPELYAPGAFQDNGDYIYISVPNSEYVEFAVTTLAPGTGLDAYTYKGDESDFVAQSGKLYNPNGTYKAKPYIKTQTPVSTASLRVGPTYHVDVTYDDDLVFKQGETQASYKIESTGPTGADEAEITNFNFDGKRRITFDLKFSKMWADDGAMYTISVKGLVGKNSGKEPMEIKYGAVNPILCSFRMNSAKNWEVYAKPTLLENEDLSMNGWQTSDGTPVSDKLRSRIALVATRTTSTDTDAMNNLMEEKLGEQNLVTSETYNISLNVCKKYVVKTGHRLRLSLGFPAGYGPEDEGVTFKAYHFKRDAQGNVTGVEEIPCVITQYGLMITCDSFSPFAIAVTENDGTTNNTQSAVITSTEGGNVTGTYTNETGEEKSIREAGNIFTLTENKTQTLNIVPEEGFEIESISVGQKTIEITNKETMQLEIGYNDIANGNNIIDVKFVAKTVAQEEAAAGRSVVMPKAAPAEIKMPTTELLGTINREIKLTPEVIAEEGNITYQWYKDGVAILGQTNKTLSIIPTSIEDSGAYTLKVTTMVGTTKEEVMSQPCNIKVRTFEVAITSTNTQTNLQELQLGEEFEVDVEIVKVQNIVKGLVSLTGQLEYDVNFLEMKEIIAQGEWQLSEEDFNQDNFKFIIDSEKLVKEQGKIFKIKFKVKDTVAEDETSSIKIKGISASGGNGLIVADDAEVEIGVKIKEEQEGEEKITSEKYVINNKDKDISKIESNTTVAMFKQNVVLENVTTNPQMVFLDKNGNTLTDESILGTGMTVKVGKTLEYKLIVTGDINGDKEVTIDDLAEIKLHLIDYKKLEGIKLKAADIDYDGEITINDVACIKLVIIGLHVIQ